MQRLCCGIPSPSTGRKNNYTEDSLLVMGSPGSSLSVLSTLLPHRGAHMGFGMYRSVGARSRHLNKSAIANRFSSSPLWGLPNPNSVAEVSRVAMLS